ncbi:hypothetical protein EJB05_50864, partial [Eragrostis curvula]
MDVTAFVRRQARHCVRETARTLEMRPLRRWCFQEAIGKALGRRESRDKRQKSSTSADPKEGPSSAPTSETMIGQVKASVPRNRKNGAHITLILCSMIDGHQALVCANVGVSEVWGKHRFLDGEPRPMQAVMKSNRDAATHRDLDGHPFVDAVLVVEVDAVNAETLEAALACRAYVRRVAADLALAVGEGEAELGGQLHLLPHLDLQSLHMGITSSIFSANDLVGVGAVDVGGVEEGDAGGDGVVDERDHVRLGLGRAVEGGHSHAAEALRRDLQTLRAKLHARHGHRSCCHGREGQLVRVCSLEQWRGLCRWQVSELYVGLTLGRGNPRAKKAPCPWAVLGIEDTARSTRKGRARGSYPWQARRALCWIGNSEGRGAGGRGGDAGEASWRQRRRRPSPSLAPRCRSPPSLASRSFSSGVSLLFTAAARANRARARQGAGKNGISGEGARLRGGLTSAAASSLSPLP